MSLCHVGNAFNRQGQLKLQNSYTKIVGEKNDTVCAQGGLYAPTTRHHDGTFYIVCTNCIHTATQEHYENTVQNFILSTADIWNDEWSDPVFYDFNAIDPSLFWDDDGKSYVIGAADQSPETVIRQIEIDVKTGKKLSKAKVLWEGITRVFPEGPHMYKKDGWYYLLIAEGGCFEDHHTVMARSRDIWGPYEANSANPVMAKTTSEDYVQYTGHGDLFLHPCGQWYFTCLGVRKRDGRFIMGRESVITTASWPEGEFPVIHKAGLEAPFPRDAGSSSDWLQHRKPERPDVGFLHIRDPVLEHYKYTDKGITLTSNKADVSAWDQPVTFVGKRHRRLEGSASATLRMTASISAGGFGLSTGLCYYKDEHRFIRAYINVDSKEIVFELVNKAKYINRVNARPMKAFCEGTDITFGVHYTQQQFTFWVSYNADDKQETVELGKIDTLDMTGHDFVGPVIGIFASAEEALEIEYPGFLMEDF